MQLLFMYYKMYTILATKIFFKRARDRNLIQVLRIQTVQVLQKHDGRTGSSVLATSISYGMGQQIKWATSHEKICLRVDILFSYYHAGKCIRRFGGIYAIWWYLRVLPVLHRPEVVDIGVNTIEKTCHMPKGL